MMEDTGGVIEPNSQVQPSAENPAQELTATPLKAPERSFPGRGFIDWLGRHKARVGLSILGLGGLGAGSVELVKLANQTPPSDRVVEVGEGKFVTWEEIDKVITTGKERDIIPKGMSTDLDHSQKELDTYKSVTGLGPKPTPDPNRYIPKEPTPEPTPTPRIVILPDLNQAVPTAVEAARQGKLIPLPTPESKP